MDKFIEKYTVERQDGKSQVIDINGIKYLQSYETIVAKYDTETEELTLLPKWNSSATTSRHMRQFINQQTVYHYESKKEFKKEIESHGKIFIEEK
jgi:hypothetical protein